MKKIKKSKKIDLGTKQDNLYGRVHEYLNSLESHYLHNLRIRK